jgi:hypothetical protein
VSSDRSAGPILDNLAAVRCALRERAVRPVRVVVLDVVAQQLFEVSLVPMRVRSQSSRRTVPTQRSANAFATGVYGGLRMIVTPSLAKTASNEPANCAAPSWIKNRTQRVVRIMKLRAAWAVHPRFGFVVAPARCTRRVSSSMKNKT